MEQPNGEQLALTSGFKGAKYKKANTNYGFIGLVRSSRGRSFKGEVMSRSDRYEYRRQTAQWV